MSYTLVARTQMQFPQYLWGAEEECRLNKDTFDPLYVQMSITDAGKVCRKEVDQDFAHCRYMGHYTENTLPQEYLIRELVFLKSNVARVCTIGAQTPYEFTNLTWDEKEKAWRTPQYTVAFHKDDIHPVKTKYRTLYGAYMDLNNNKDITPFLDWAYDNNITLEVDPIHAQIRPIYGKRVPPNYILKDHNLIYVGGVLCKYRTDIKVNWQGTIFSQFCNLTYEQLETIVRKMSRHTRDICVCETTPGVYSIIKGALSAYKCYQYKYIPSSHDVCIPQALFDDKDGTEESYYLNDSGDVLVSKYSLAEIRLRKTFIGRFIGRIGGSNLVVLAINDDGSRWIPYEKRKLIRYKAPIPYELYRYKKPVKIVYDSQETLVEKETSGKRKQRLKIKYTPKNPGTYNDTELIKYNECMEEVNKGNFEIISAQSECIEKITNLSEFRNLGYLYYLLLNRHGNSSLYQNSKILKALAADFPEIIRCECNTYFLRRQLATLNLCLENFSQISNQSVIEFLKEISHTVLSVDQITCKKLLIRHI